MDHTLPPPPTILDVSGMRPTCGKLFKGGYVTCFFLYFGLFFSFAFLCGCVLPSLSSSASKNNRRRVLSSHLPPSPRPPNVAPKV